MIEIPESINLSKQLNKSIGGKKIVSVCANHSPHSFAWYYDDPQKYNDLLVGKTIYNAVGIGCMVEISAENYKIVLNDGTNIRYLDKNQVAPAKHQLYIQFDDNSAIACVVQMYGGMYCFKAGEFDNPYYLVAKQKPLPITDEFDINYFDRLRNDDTVKLTAKVFLATEQRIPGIGNGVLQDILFNAKIHPKRKIKDISDIEYEGLYTSIKTTLKSMIDNGGRDTEKNIYGEYGGYKTKLSKKTVGQKCSICGTEIKKATYMGGTIYYCEGCQKL